EFLCDAGWRVTCVAKNPKGVEQYAEIFAEQGVSVFIGLEEHVERLAMAEPFDLAILGFWHIAEPLMKTLRQCCASTRLVVDSGDLHFLRHARRIVRDSDTDLGILDSQFGADMARELSVYAAADAVLAVSRKEAEFVGDFLGDPTRAHYVPDC